MQASILLKYEDEILSNELIMVEMSALKKKKTKIKKHTFECHLIVRKNCEGLSKRLNSFIFSRWFFDFYHIHFPSMLFSIKSTISPFASVSLCVLSKILNHFTYLIKRLHINRASESSIMSIQLNKFTITLR